jgi:hypothetical protein
VATLNEILTNKNLINLLAGVGAGIDPKGVGGVLGAPVIQFNRNVAAQEREAAQEKKQGDANTALIDILSGKVPLTPAGQPGARKIEATDTGLKLDVDMPPGTVPTGTVPGGTAPQLGPIAPTGAGVAPVPTPTGVGTGVSQSDLLAALRPFLSALLGLQVP